MPHNYTIYLANPVINNIVSTLNQLSYLCVLVTEFLTNSGLTINTFYVPLKGYKKVTYSFLTFCHPQQAFLSAGLQPHGHKMATSAPDYDSHNIFKRREGKEPLLRHFSIFSWLTLHPRPADLILHLVLARTELYGYSYLQKKKYGKVNVWSSQTFSREEEKKERKWLLSMQYQHLPLMLITSLTFHLENS